MARSPIVSALAPLGSNATSKPAPSASANARESAGSSSSPIASTASPSSAWRSARASMNGNEARHGTHHDA